MKLTELLRLQTERLQAAAEVFRAMLAEHKPGSPAFEALHTSLKETEAERRSRDTFRRQAEAALAACQSYRQSPSPQGFAELREAYERFFVAQEHPLATRYLPKMAPLGVRAGCRSCAMSLISALETHLNAEATDDFPEAIGEDPGFLGI